MPVKNGLYDFLQLAMQYIKYSQNLQELERITNRNSRFMQMDRETAEVINTVTNSKLKFDEKEEKVSMCLAMDQLWENGRNEGLEQGMEQGRKLNLITQLCRKVIKGKSPEVIAEELEAEIGEIERIYKVAVKYAPDYDTDKIYAELSA